MLNSFLFLQKRFGIGQWSFLGPGSVKTTPQMTGFRDGKVCNNCLQMKLTITEYSLTTSAQLDYKIQEERTLYLVLRLRGENEHDTNDNVTTKIQTDFHTEHMKLYT